MSSSPTDAASGKPPEGQEMSSLSQANPKNVLAIAHALGQLADAAIVTIESREMGGIRGGGEGEEYGGGRRRKSRKARKSRRYRRYRMSRRPRKSKKSRRSRRARMMV